MKPDRATPRTGRDETLNPALPDSTVRGAMQATGVEESEQEICEQRPGASSGRWFVGSGTGGVRSSGRLDSSLELRAERTDDGVLVAARKRADKSAWHVLTWPQSTRLWLAA